MSPPTRHIETACDRCVLCHEPIPSDMTDYDATLLVSVLLADDAVYDCVLAMHTECNEARLQSGIGIELMVVTALGRAMVRAAEAGFVRREGQSPARSSPKSGREKPRH